MSTSGKAFARVAAIYDLHGNAVALEAVLASMPF